MHVRLTDRFVKSAVPKGRKSPIFMDDEVIGFACSSFAALMSPEVAHLRPCAVCAKRTSDYSRGKTFAV